MTLQRKLTGYLELSQLSMTSNSFYLPVTSSLVAPTPFTKYPFLISHFQPPALQPLTLVALFQIDSY